MSERHGDLRFGTVSSDLGEHGLPCPLYHTRGQRRRGRQSAWYHPKSLVHNNRQPGVILVKGVDHDIAFAAISHLEI